jgi:hypothetical protein
MSETSPFLSWPKDAVDISSNSSDPKGEGAADLVSPSRPNKLDFELVFLAVRELFFIVSFFQLCHVNPKLKGLFASDCRIGCVYKLIFYSWTNSCHCATVALLGLKILLSPG